jgi:hypothetical protein
MNVYIEIMMLAVSLGLAVIYTVIGIAGEYLQRKSLAVCGYLMAAFWLLIHLTIASAILP